MRVNKMEVTRVRGTVYRALLTNGPTRRRERDAPVHGAVDDLLLYPDRIVSPILSETRHRADAFAEEAVGDREHVGLVNNGDLLADETELLVYHKVAGPEEQQDALCVGGRGRARKPSFLCGAMHAR